MKPQVVLVGAPGAGKSTIGALLAARLGVQFRDTDADISARTGKSVPDIFVEDGEAHFRKLECACVAEALAEYDGVLALGGGAVLAESTRRLLAEQVVVYLSVDLASAVARVGLDQGRPLLAINPRATLRHLLEQRRPLYEQVARHTVDTSHASPEEIVDELLQVLK